MPFRLMLKIDGTGVDAMATRPCGIQRPYPPLSYSLSPFCHSPPASPFLVTIADAASPAKPNGSCLLQERSRPAALVLPGPRGTVALEPAAASGRDVYRIPSGSPARRSGYRRTEQQKKAIRQRYLDRNVDMGELLSSLAAVSTPEQLHAVMSPYADSGHHRLSLRFMVSLLSREPDWRRSVALLDWMLDVASYQPSVFAYNVVIRNAVRAHQWELATGLVDEMRTRHAITPDRCTYATLISSLGKAGHLDAALGWLQRMERDGVSGDLILYSSLIELSRKLGDHSKAVSLFSRLRLSGIAPDLIAYNSMINVFGKAGLLREARLLLKEMEAGGAENSSNEIGPDIVSYSTLLTAFVENRRYVEAVSLFSEMRERGVRLDLTTCNIMIDVYGQLDMARDADRLFWSMRKMGIEPNVVSYNTLLRVYGEAGLFGEAVHLFLLMQRKGVEQNVVTYNTMIKTYGMSLEHEKAGNLVQEMQRRGIQPNAVTYSTIISIWGKAGKLDRASMLFQKLRAAGTKIDRVLYQTMMVVYERAGLVAHAKRLLHDLRDPGNDIPKGTAITILAGAGRIEEATWLFRRALDEGVVKDIAIFQCMMDLFAINKKHRNVVEVFEKMRASGYFPNSDMISMALNAYQKLQEFNKAQAAYQEMQVEGCIFMDQVHFQMLSLLGSQRDFRGMESLLTRLDSDPNIDKKELHLVAAGIYDRANRLDDASHIISNMSKRRDQ